MGQPKFQKLELRQQTHCLERKEFLPKKDPADNRDKAKVIVELKLESDWIGTDPKPRKVKEFINVLAGEDANPAKPRVRGQSRQNERNFEKLMIESVEVVESRRPLKPAEPQTVGALPRQNDMRPQLRSNIILGDDGGKFDHKGGRKLPTSSRMNQTTLTWRH